MSKVLPLLKGTFAAAAGLFLAFAVGALVSPIEARAQAPVDVSGDPERGRPLYTSYKCYACHGFGGETGSPRLVPMSRTEEGFIAYVRSPRTFGMPNYSSVSREQLADIYAYIRSMPENSPAVEEIPLLEAILDQVQEDD